VKPQQSTADIVSLYQQAFLIKQAFDQVLRYLDDL
jgi:hypothetical protein